MFLRLVLPIAGGLAALFIARDAPNFELVQGIIAVAVIAAIVVLLGLSRRR